MALIRRANAISFSLDDTKIHSIAKESICLMQIRVQSFKYIHYSIVTSREFFLCKRSFGRHTYYYLQAVDQCIRLGIKYHGTRYSSPMGLPCGEFQRFLRLKEFHSRVANLTSKGEEKYHVRKKLNNSAPLSQ